MVTLGGGQADESSLRSVFASFASVLRLMTWERRRGQEEQGGNGERSGTEFDACGAAIIGIAIIK